MFAPRKAIWCVRRRKSFYSIGTPTFRRGAGGEPKAPCWHDKRQLCRRNSPLAGPDAPTAARVVGLAVPRGVHTFLSMAKEKCAKESQRHGATGKRLLLPILTAGLAMSRAMELDSYHTGAERARARLFSADKMGGPFSLRCLSPRCPGAVGGEHTQPLQGGVFWRSLYFFARQKASGKSNPRWPLLRAMRPVAEWRSLLCSWRESAPDPRAARPSAERR